MARRGNLSRLVAVGVCGASLATGVVALGQPAAAQSVKAQIASAEHQLTQLNSQAEAASERYNGARIKLQAASESATAAQRRLALAQRKVAALQAAATAFAVAAYTNNASMSATTITQGSAEDFIGRVSALQAVSTSESEALVSVDAARRTEEQAQADTTAALSAQRAATTAMSADRSQVLAAAAKEQTILTQLQAKEAAIIKAAKAAKAAKARAAALAAEREARRLAAQKAAAAAAAKALAAQPVSQPAPKPAPAPRSTSSGGSNQGSPVAASGGASTAVAWAYREIGKPYVWGAAGPDSFDCSGLAMYVWAKAGVYLEHFTGDQWNEGQHISRGDLQPGDLVFFAYNTSNPSTIHHVGIYVGGGQMIDAPYTGVDVRKEPAFRSDYIGAVRP